VLGAAISSARRSPEGILKRFDSYRVDKHTHTPCADVNNELHRARVVAKKPREMSSTHIKRIA